MEKRKSQKVSKLPRRVSEMSKETLEITLRKKRECNAKALQIVERLLENTVSEEWFLDCLRFIGESHFQDVIEERSITMVCGYPLCSVKLKNIPNQQFRISTKLNKVYDITERKNFCSNQCYKASTYLKQQLLTSPLWLRENEEIPKFKLLPVHSTSGVVGEEVDIGQSNPLKEELKQLHKHESPNDFTSVSQFMRDSLSELASEYDSKEKKQKKKSGRLKDELQKQEQIIEKSIPEAETMSTDEVLQSQMKVTVSSEGVLESHRLREMKTSNNTENLATDDIQIVQNGQFIETNTTNSESQCFDKGNKHTYSEVSEDINQITSCLNEIHIDVNEQNVNNLISTSSNIVSNDNNISNDQSSSNIVSNDNSISNDQSSKTDVPSRHKKETKIKKNKESKKKKRDISADIPPMTSAVIHIEKCLHEWFTIDTMCFLFGEERVKEMVSEKGDCIKEYYKAVNKSSWDPKIQEQYMAICRRLNIMEIEEYNGNQDDDSSHVPTKPLPDYTVVKEEGRKMELKVKSYFQGRTVYEDENVNSSVSTKDDTTVLPLVDLHAQNALRRRIVLDRLNRILPDLLRTFDLSSRDVSGDVRNLIITFTLGAHNITFKPPEWSLLGLIIIKMLSIKDTRLRILLDSEQVTKYTTMMLMGFQQDGGYLDRLMAWLTDLDNLLHKQ